MDKKHVVLIVVAALTLFGVIGIGMMNLKMATNLDQFTDRLNKVESQLSKTQVVSSTIVELSDNQHTPTTTREVYGISPCKGDCDSTVSELVGYTDDFTLFYPKQYYVALTEDARFNPGVKNLRITNKPGTLAYREIGSGVLEQGQFYDGIQFDIRKLTEGQMHFTGEEKMIKTSNPMVLEYIPVCDGPGCAYKTYYIQAKGAMYVMEVRATSNYSTTNADIQTIVSSIK